MGHRCPEDSYHILSIIGKVPIVYYDQQIQTILPSQDVNFVF